MERFLKSYGTFCVGNLLGLREDVSIPAHIDPTTYSVLDVKCPPIGCEHNTTFTADNTVDIDEILSGMRIGGCIRYR